MGIHMEWANAAHTGHTVVTKGFDVREWDYLPEGEYDDETTVDEPVAVVLSNDDAYVLQGSAIKIRALLRAIDADLEPYVEAEAKAAAEEIEAEQRRTVAVKEFVSIHGDEAIDAAAVLGVADEMRSRIEAEVNRRRKEGEITELLKPVGR